MAKSRQPFGDFDIGGTSQANVSEISFPSHVSGLESFSDFEKTFPALNDEKSPEQNVKATKTGVADDSTDKNSLKLDLPASLGTASPGSVQSDTADISNGLLDLNTPNTQREQLVFDFLSQEQNPRTLFGNDEASFNDTGTAETSLHPVFEQQRQTPPNEENVGARPGFGVDLQRPGLDGSSSDSDDDSPLNFARSRIGTVHQQHLTAFLEDRQPDSGSEVLEERQLAEGDDVFSRGVPGDGGGGGDGSSGHSDSDVDGDGGVAIRVRTRRNQQGRVRATAAIQPISQQNEELPERERPVGDSVPAFNQQSLNQNQNVRMDANEENQYGVTPRSDTQASQDVDSSQDSVLSARFFAAPNLSAPLSGSTSQNLWMEDSASFRLSESAAVSPGNGDETPDNFVTDNNSFDSFGTRNVVGNDYEGDKTITGSTPSLLKDAQESDNSKTKVDDDSIFRPVLSATRKSNDNTSVISTNPFMQTSDYSTNPFSSFAYHKNPFDPLDMSEMQNRFSFSGFGEQNSPKIGTSSFKVNSQDAEALFDDDEKSCQHSNTVSKLADISSESAWNVEDVNSKVEVRLSAYFNAMSEEMGTMSSDRPDRPRPVFYDSKVVKTPPPLPPFMLHSPGRDESSGDISSFTFDGQELSSHGSNAERKIDNATSIKELSSTFTRSKPILNEDLTKKAMTDLVKKTGAEKDTIQANDGTIRIPKTNDEAECLLHDIGVGRVSLQGISGVNISNLAAKIAVAANLDPKFIFKLLISSIEGERRNITNQSAPQFDANTKKPPSIDIKKQGFEVSSAPTVSSTPHNMEYKTSVHTLQGKMPNSNKGNISQGRPLQLDGAHYQTAKGSGLKQDQSSLKLSDLDKTLTPLKSTKDGEKHLTSFSIQSLSSSSVTSHPIGKLRRSGSPLHVSSEQIVSQEQYKSPVGLVTSAPQGSRPARPISSVMPLVALPESRPLYRDSGVQCLTRQDQIQSVERGARFDRPVSTPRSRCVSTADAAIQCEVVGSADGIGSETDLVTPSHHSLKKMSGVSLSATSKSSIKMRTNQFLSSTAILGAEPDDEPTKAITLSPVVAEVGTSLLEQDMSNWKPLKAASSSKQTGTTVFLRTHAQHENPTMDRFSDTTVQFHKDQIHDILPRLSDIKVRESNAMFYPLMATNQTVIGRPSIVPSTQLQPLHHPTALKAPRPAENKNDAVSPVSSKVIPMPTIQIIVPNEICFSGVQCIGVAINECLPIHNPSSRWIQCMLELVFYSVNGSQAEVGNSCAFGMQPSVYIPPHTTETVKVTFRAELAGVYMAKVNITAVPIVTDTSILSNNEMYQNVVHIEGVAELPDIEVFHEQSDAIDFGEMPGRIHRARCLKLINKGRADVPLKLVLSGDPMMRRCYEFVDADLTPIASSDAHSEADETQAPVLNIILTGCQRKEKDVLEPELVWIQFKAPDFADRGLEMKLGPPNHYAARVDIEIDAKGSGIIVGSVVLKAIVGIARLHAPRSLQAISLSTTEAQLVSRGIPFRNAGNISLEIILQVSKFTDLFSVVPDHVTLSPGESTEVFVHFLSMSSVTVESLLLVSIHPDGPQYEVVLRGTCTTLKPVKENEEIPVLLCNKPVLCWAGVPIGRSMQQRACLRNNSMTKDLQITLSIEGNHSDFQIQNTFDFKETNKSSHETTLKHQSEVPIHVLFVPSTFGMISSALVIKPAGEGPKFKIPLHGYGGCSMLQLTDAQKVGDKYWIDAGEVTPERQNIVKLSLQNIGNRAAFVKIVCYADVRRRQIYPSSHMSIAPNDFILPEKCKKQLVVVFQPTDAVLYNAKDKPCTAASLAIFSGDESMRQFYRKHKPKSGQLTITKEGPLQHVIFDAPFVDEEKVINDIEYPNIPNWESFFVSSTSRTVVSLVARPSKKEHNAHSPSERPLKLDPKEFVIDQTPARALPVEAASSDSAKRDSTAFDSHQPNKETWTVVPDHVVLTAPNTDKSTARIQMINYSDKPLEFEFSWPTQSLIITPSKGRIPPRSQLIVFVSTKPSFLSTGGELPWRGRLYVQCEGVQKCVRVQIREDLALDSSPLSGMSRRLAPLNPSNTPYRTIKQPTKVNPLFSVEPASVVFETTAINRFQENALKIENTSSAALKWVLSSIAPPYFKDVSESGDIFRTTYTAFRFTKHSGQLQPHETTMVQVVFQPRDFGEYSQFWDLQVAVESTGETGKSRIELRGKGVYPDQMQKDDDGKLVGGTRPILKPPADNQVLDVVSTAKQSAPTKRTEQDPEDAVRDAKPSDKKNRGVYVKEDVLNFESTNKGESCELEFRLCNVSKELQKVRFSGLKPPFSMKLNKLAIKSKSFIRVPVYFTPTEANSKSEGLLEVNALTGTSRTSYVKLIGVCHAK